MRAVHLTDSQWAVIEQLLPPPARTGRPRADDRSTLNGILYVLRSGCRWQDLPGRADPGEARPAASWQASSPCQPNDSSRRPDALYWRPAEHVGGAPMAAEHRGLLVSRRRFVQGVGVAGLGLLAGCGTLPGQTQPPVKVLRIGWLGPSSGPDANFEAFRQ